MKKTYVYMLAFNPIFKFIMESDEQWKPYDGDYVKVFYDVITTDYILHRSCWPNAGKFCDVRTGERIPEDRVLLVQEGESYFKEALHGNRNRS